MLALILPGDRRATLSWAGAGIFFFWQLGAMKFLSERFDLTQVPMAGASGGALVSVLAACGVPADRVLQRAYDLSMKYKIWERPMGLMGVWGSLIEEWLNSLLPDDAADRCRDRVNIVVTQLPSLAQVGITDFKSKADLINVAMASSHIPIFLDMKVARKCRGSYCVDGSFPDFFYNENSDLLQLGGDAVVFDYFFDANIPRKGRMDMLEVKTFEEVQHIMQLGYEYAARLQGDGQFDHFQTGQFALNPLEDSQLRASTATKSRDGESLAV
ncbi:MAG: hypothetical protein WDW38_000967 [Sanguina aurantia]